MHWNRGAEYWLSRWSRRKKSFILLSERETTVADSSLTTFGFWKRTIIGTWNVRTLSESPRLVEVCSEMDRYKIENLMEIRWLGQGEFQTRDRPSLVVFRQYENSRVNGVGILLTSKAKKSLMEFKSILKRIIFWHESFTFRPAAIHSQNQWTRRVNIQRLKHPAIADEFVMQYW